MPTTQPMHLHLHACHCACLTALLFSAIGLTAGCGQQADTGLLSANTAGDVASSGSRHLNWNKLVEQASREKWSRIESEQPLGDAELTALTGMTHLRDVDLPGGAASDKALDALVSLSSLEVLILGDTTISDDGLAKLGRLHSLRDLNLNQSRVTDRGLSHLAALPRLELLRLGTSEITDDGLAAAGRISTLRFLILQNAQITGRGFKHLHELKNLESLYLQGNPLSGEGVADLRRALPRLHPDW